MQWDYVYADYGVTVTFKVSNDTALGQLTDREVMSLQQMIYLTLNCFTYTRALYLQDLTDKNKIIRTENEKESDNEQVA